ncbi:ABC transporter ATP-binding protein [bacterium]|nr:ABC transporter ATP-binding protein [bacterium]
MQPDIRKNIKLTLLWMASGEMMLLFQAYPIKLYIDRGLKDADNLGTWTLVVGLAVLAAHLLEEGIDQLVTRFRFRALWGNYKLINVLGAKHLLRLGASFHTNSSSGEKDSIVARNHKKIDVLTDQLVFNTGPLCFRICAILLFSFSADWRAGILAIASVVSYLLVLRYSQGLSWPHFLEFREQFKAIEISEGELSHHALTIDEQGLVKDFSDNHASKMQGLYDAELIAVPRWRRHMGLQFICLAFLRACYYPLAYIAWRDGVSVGTLILLSGILERMWSNLGRFHELQRTMREGVPALTEMADLLELQPAVETTQSPRTITCPRGEIVFSSVSFSYGNGGLTALSDINFRIHPGEMIALIGASGGGKSTIARLAMRLYDPTAGSITFDGIDLRELCPQYLRRSLIGYVAQDNVLFDRSIGENIKIGNPSASCEDMKLAAKSAAIAEYIESLPEGYDTLVGERGVKLSGGQRQRLALARALIKNPVLLVLDEPTSALDAESQDLVKDTLRELADRRVSTLIIAHRMSTIEPADRIISLDSGSIEFIGTVAEHEAHDGIYMDLKRREGL